MISKYTLSALFASSLVVSLSAVPACSSTETASTAPDAAKILAEQGPTVTSVYSTMVLAHYELVDAKVKALAAAVDAFVADPTQAKFEAAKTAWKDSRPLYTQSEVYRFYDGPIEEVEGLINSWPMDENYVDYVKAATSDAGGAAVHPALGYAITDDGIINNPLMFPVITKDVLRDANELGEKNLSAGFHAIEFLLWGQDFDAAGPGKRPYTDYVTGAAGTAKNQDRRRAYLKAVTDLLVDDIGTLVTAWKNEGDTYGASFAKLPPAEALAKILKGMGSLGGVEIANERMNNAYVTKEQEEEHNCFSDTTTDDLYNDGVGIQNVYLAQLQGKDRGASVSSLVAALRPDLDTTMKTQLAAALAATKAIPAPFDQAILGSDDADGRKKIKAAMVAWTAATATIVEIGAAFGLRLNIE